MWLWSHVPAAFFPSRGDRLPLREATGLPVAYLTTPPSCRSDGNCFTATAAPASAVAARLVKWPRERHFTSPKSRTLRVVERTQPWLFRGRHQQRPTATASNRADPVHHVVIGGRATAVAFLSASFPVIIAWHAFLGSENCRYERQSAPFNIIHPLQQFTSKG